MCVECIQYSTDRTVLVQSLSHRRVKVAAGALSAPYYVDRGGVVDGWWWMVDGGGRQTETEGGERWWVWIVLYIVSVISFAPGLRMMDWAGPGDEEGWFRGRGLDRVVPRLGLSTFLTRRSGGFRSYGTWPARRRQMEEVERGDRIRWGR